MNWPAIALLLSTVRVASYNAQQPDDTAQRYSSDIETGDDVHLVTFCQGNQVDIQCPRNLRVIIHEVVYDLHASYCAQQQNHGGVSLRTTDCQPIDACNTLIALCSAQNQQSQCKNITVSDELFLDAAKKTVADSAQCLARRSLTVSYCCSQPRRTSTEASQMDLKNGTQLVEQLRKLSQQSSSTEGRTSAIISELQLLERSIVSNVQQLNSQETDLLVQSVLSTANELLQQSDWLASDCVVLGDQLLQVLHELAFGVLSLGSVVQARYSNLRLFALSVDAGADAVLGENGAVVLFTGNMYAAGTKVHVVLAECSNASHLFTAQDAQNCNQSECQFRISGRLQSNVLSVVTRAKTPHLRSNQSVVRLALRLTSPSTSAAKCGFWRLNEARNDGHWSSEGCVGVQQNSSHVLCECSHLTSFAVLMDYSGATEQLSQSHKDWLRYITLLGLSISCVSLILLTWAFFTLRIFRASKTGKIKRHLVVSLLIAFLAFLLVSVVDFSQQNLLCKAAAGLLHYLFLVAFAWFAVEGIHLHITLVLVFSPRSPELIFRCFCLAAYAVPLVPVAVTAAGWPEAYGPVHGAQFCWLQANGGFVWAFVGPVCLVLLCNTVAFATACYVICTRPPSHAQAESGSAWADFRKWARTSFVLVNLLGLTWALGLLYWGEQTLAFAYVSTALNSLQGLLLLLVYVLLDKKVVQEIRDTLQHSQSSFVRRMSTSSSSTGATRTITVVRQLNGSTSSAPNQKYSVSCTSQNTGSDEAILGSKKLHDASASN